MKRYFLYIACACLVLALNSCIKDEFTGGNIFCRDAQLNLTLSLGAETRGDTPNNGVGDGTNDDDATNAVVKLNENLIKDIEIFLYPQGKEGEDAVFAYRIPLATGQANSTTVSNVTVSAGQLAKLFPNADVTECSAYVVANYATGRTTANADGKYLNTSVAKLKALEHTANFETTDGIDVSNLDDPTLEDDFGNKLTSVKPQQKFVMDSDVATLKKEGNNIVSKNNATIYLTRAASKITFRATIAETIEIDGETWTSDLEHVTVAFHNCVNTGAVDNGSDFGDFTMPTTPNYEVASGVQMAPLEGFGGEAPEFEGDVEGVENWSTVDHLTPFYTYSSQWNEGADNESYIMLTVPWYIEVKDTENNEIIRERYTTYNYFVPINAIDAEDDEGNPITIGKFVRNKHYRINLRVGVLGDLDDLSEATYSYEVLEWVGNDINVNLSRPKYLVVEKDYVEMNNLTSFSVPYSSSDAVSAKIISVSRDNVKGRIVKEDIRDDAESTGTESGWNDFNNQDFSVSTDGGVVTLTHNLDNDRNSDYFDYVPYEIIVEVVNESGFKERITFVQYPAMYIVADTNTDYQQNTNHTDEWVNTWNDNHGYQWVNGYRGDDYDSAGSGNNAYHYVDLNETRVQFLASSNGLSSNAGNKNPNMYTITVSSFSDGSYLVGDPRTTQYDKTLKDAKLGNSDYYVFASAPALSGTSPRRLQYYYPTDASDNTINVISPKFRVASSYSVLGSEYLTSREVARRRCASYQEDGYPAGRWRMATAAEMQFMIQLSQQGLIPALFSSNTNYWCAHGVINYVTGATTATLIKGTSNSSGGSIRCVYDEWYWGSEKAIVSDNSAVFTWGDELRPGDSDN